MNNVKSNIRSSFRTEMVAAGLYSVLSDQYGKRNPQLGIRFKEASEQEHMHGRLFKQFYFNTFNEEAGNEKIWLAAGRFAGRMMTLIPLKKKMKILEEKESAAVKMIEARLAANEEPSIAKILKRILPDEISHAGIYADVFGS